MPCADFDLVLAGGHHPKLSQAVFVRGSRCRGPRHAAWGVLGLVPKSALPNVHRLDQGQGAGHDHGAGTIL